MYVCMYVCIVSPYNSMKFINNAGSYAQNNAAAELATFEQVIVVVY